VGVRAKRKKAPEQRAPHVANQKDGLKMPKFTELHKTIAAFEDAVVSLSLDMQEGSPERSETPDYLLKLQKPIDRIARAVERARGEDDQENS
jgi:hypothetical protein